MTAPRRYWMGSVSALAAILLAGCGASDASSPCDFKATDSCTPHIAPNGTVQVDTLKWHVVHAFKATTFGPLFPNGVYVVVKLNVYNAKNSAVTLSQDTVSLRIGARNYPNDTAAAGAMESGDAGAATALDQTQINPAFATDVVAVFDVPPSLLGDNPAPEVEINELGPFGTTHGFIQLSI